ncbi:hypothetical protein IAT40_007412 [Kwoniella sp. CBS 6097]
MASHQQTPPVTVASAISTPTIRTNAETRVTEEATGTTMQEEEEESEPAQSLAICTDVQSILVRFPTNEREQMLDFINKKQRPGEPFVDGDFVKWVHPRTDDRTCSFIAPQNNDVSSTPCRTSYVVNYGASPSVFEMTSAANDNSHTNTEREVIEPNTQQEKDMIRQAEEMRNKIRPHLDAFENTLKDAATAASASADPSLIWNDTALMESVYRRAHGELVEAVSKIVGFSNLECRPSVVVQKSFQAKSHLLVQTK